MAAKVPLGLRQNNPGNIRLVADPEKRWKGFSGTVGAIAEVDSMSNGLRALGKQLLVYVEGPRKAKPVIGKAAVDKNGKPVVDKNGNQVWEGIIPIWAPPTENDTAKYVAYVADICQVDPEEDLLNLRDGDTMFWLLTAIGEFENGPKSFHALVGSADIESALQEIFA